MKYSNLFFFLVQTPVRALPYWWLVARCPYPWPSPRQCELQSSGTGRLHQQCLSQVVLGRPADLFQSAGGRSAAATMRWWSSAGAERARWPKNLRRWDLTTSETGVQAVTSRTVSFVVCLVYGIRRIFCRHRIKCIKTLTYSLGDGPCLTSIEQNW